jgi:hypothetical protein
MEIENVRTVNILMIRKQNKNKSFYGLVRKSATTFIQAKV